MHENRETSVLPADSAGRCEKAKSRNAGAHEAEESDRGIVPMNQPNKEAKPSSAEAGEGRLRTKENIARPNTRPAQNGGGVSQGLSGGRRVAREKKRERFTSLLYHLSVDLLLRNFYGFKREASP